MGASRNIDSRSLARLRSGATVAPSRRGGAHVRAVPLAETNACARLERRARARRVALCVAVLAAMAFLSLGVMGAQGQYYLGSRSYELYTPLQVLDVLYYHAYQAIADATHWFDMYSPQWLEDNVPGYWAIPERAAVVGVTLVCAALLSVSGMLYQTTFANPIAGPSILGVSAGTSLGVMVLVMVYGAAAPLMVGERYGLCYGFGAAILLFVLLAARRLSRGGRGFNVVSLLLIGSIVSQLLGFIVTYVTLFVMDESAYALYFEVSQRLVVDTSPLSWLCLGTATVLSFVPVFFLRYRMNALPLDEAEARPLGLDVGRLRTVALLCGAVMILAAQVHTGMVGLVSLVVPFLARRWFGCEFSHQLTGSVCIGAILLLVCRDIADLIPFVGDGLAVGSVAGLVLLPLFLAVVARQQKGWSD